MLEAYQAFGDMDAMLELTESLVAAVTAEVLGTTDVAYQGCRCPSPRRGGAPPWRSCVSEACGTDVSVHTPSAELTRLCETHEVPVEPAWGPADCERAVREARRAHPCAAHVRDPVSGGDLAPRQRNDADPT